jgi:hypothetical protein
VLSFTVATALIIGLVVFVDANSTPKAQAPHLSSKGVLETRHDSAEIIAQDQLPHVVRLAATSTPRGGIQRAITAFMHQQIAFGAITGPLGSTQCFAVGTTHAGHVAFRCAALSGGTSYPFVGVVDPRAHAITYCKHDPPPTHGARIPLSPRCAA